MQLTNDDGAAVRLAGTVKSDLVAFATTAPFDKPRRRIEKDMTRAGVSAEGVRVGAVEELLFTFRYDDGSTVLDRFVARRGTSDEVRATALGLRDGIASIFEVVEDTEAGPEAFLVRDCASDLVLCVAPTLPEGVGAMPAGMFLMGRLNPISGTDLWTPSGAMQNVGPEHRETIADAVGQSATRNPEATHRNPERYRKALETSAMFHERFVARNGADMVFVPGSRVPEVMATAQAGENDEAALAETQRGQLAPTGLLEADEVLVYHHPIDGISLYRNMRGVLRALDAGAAADASDLADLRDALRVPEVPGFLVDRLVTERLPAAADAVAAALRLDTVDWERDGASILAGLPGDRQPVPVAVMPDICLEFMEFPANPTAD